MAASWDPQQYLRYEDHRLRPAVDLLDRIPAIDAEEIWDLGCGTGHITADLARRWPDAAVHGLDSSPSMLTQAAGIEGIDWVLGSIGSWKPRVGTDLIFSNAALHWLPDHQSLFPELVGHLRRGGVLAVQMPRNFGEPSHTELAAVASDPRFSDTVGHLVRPPPVGEPGWYHDLLRPHTASLDVWETVYTQLLSGDDPVAEWTKGSAARPYLDALGSQADAFMDAYRKRLRAAYPASSDGHTLFPFRRLFIVAVV